MLAVCSATLPDTHPDLQAARHNLANTKFDLGDLPGALALRERVLAVRSATLPDTHPDLQAARGSLANTKFALGDLPGALALLEQVLGVCSTMLPDTHPDMQIVRLSLANAKRSLGDLQGALALEEQVLALCSATLPDTHPDLQTARGNLAATKFALGDLRGALALQEQALALRSATLPDTHPDLQGARHNLALTKFALGDLRGALALQEQVLALRSATLPDTHPDLQASRSNLALTNYALGDLAAAAQLHREGVSGAVGRLSAQIASLRDIVEVAKAAAGPLSHIASLLDLGPALSAEVAAALRIDGLYLLEATRSAPVHLSRLRQRIRTQHPEASARLLPQLGLANRRLEEAVGLLKDGRLDPDGKRVSREDAILEAINSKERLEREWLALIPPDARTSPDAATLAKALAPGEVAISFCTYTRWTNDRDKPWVSTSQSRYGAFVLTSSGEVSWHSLAPSAEVDALVADIRQLITASRPASVIASRLSDLRKLLLDPVLAAIPSGTRSLVLSLTDGMHLLPLDDIPLAPGKLLGDAFSVRSVWSLRALLEAPGAPSAEPAALVVGCPDYDAKSAGLSPKPAEAVAPVARADARAVDATKEKDHRSVLNVFTPLIHTKREA
ncbi:MAG: CHAT domain-containing protein, partial [Planctomycetes bacterium]|nr:CHAT domain-containing protein [Planctomycetota bacterium]